MNILPSGAGPRTSQLRFVNICRTEPSEGPSAGLGPEFRRWARETQVPCFTGEDRGFFRPPLFADYRTSDSIHSMKPEQSIRKIGLARALSKLGDCSRSQATELIRAGRVRLNGVVRRDPETPVHLETDRIEVDRLVVHAQSKIYLMLNKP